MSKIYNNKFLINLLKYHYFFHFISFFLLYFIYFLQFYQILYVDNRPIIDNNTLASLTLLIAESNPKEKEILIDLIMNFLV